MPDTLLRSCTGRWSHGHRLAQSHQSEFSAMLDALGGDEARAARVWAAAVTSSKFRGNELLATQMLGALELANARAGQAPASELRALAQQTANLASTWTDAQIVDAVAALAQRHGITAPNQIAVMKDLLQRPGLGQHERVEALGQSRGVMSNCITAIAKTLGLPSRNLRVGLAEQVGMPYSTLVARIGTPQVPGLGARVIGRVNPSHREGVAELFLTAQGGTRIERSMYETLETVFTSDPYHGDRHGAMPFMSRLFATDRLEMLRVMGFSNEQILRMNPVGNELAQRLDPALGTYSPQEQALRQAKGLPNTREEAALRLWTATTDQGKGMSYRRWIALGVLSDKPWFLPQDIYNAYLSAAPGSSPTGGSNDANFAFRVAENLRGRQIPRGSQPDLIDRNYRQDINRLLLQTFGLSATNLATGQRESIPTTFEPRERPAPNEQPATPARRSTEASSDDDAPQVTWQQLLPLLQPRSEPAPPP